MSLYTDDQPVLSTGCGPARLIFRGMRLVSCLEEDQISVEEMYMYRYSSQEVLAEREEIAASILNFVHISFLNEEQWYVRIPEVRL